MDAPAYSVQPVEFTSQKTRCRGDLYYPASIDSPPVVIMAHGFGAERSFRLPAFAERFVRKGLAVLVFDYRGFGDSDGHPRNLVDPGRHLADWKSAIEYVRTLDKVDTKKIGLWGSSFSGGHVIVTASRDPDISAIVAQVPFVDSISSIRKQGLWYLLRATPHAVLDVTRMLTFRAPHHIKLVGKSDEFAVMNTPESYPGYMSMVPEDTDWQNQCPARVLLTFSTYRPVTHAGKVKCPALIMMGEQDSLIDADVVEQTAKAMPDCKLVRYPFGHFDIYTGDAFENAVSEQAAFFGEHLS